MIFRSSRACGSGANVRPERECLRPPSPRLRQSSAELSTSKPRWPRRGACAPIPRASDRFPASSSLRPGLRDFGTLARLAHHASSVRVQGTLRNASQYPVVDLERHALWETSRTLRCRAVERPTCGAAVRIRPIASRRRVHARGCRRWVDSPSRRTSAVQQPNSAGRFRATSSGDWLAGPDPLLSLAAPVLGAAVQRVRPFDCV